MSLYIFCALRASACPVLGCRWGSSCPQGSQHPVWQLPRGQLCSRVVPPPSHAVGSSDPTWAAIFPRKPCLPHLPLHRIGRSSSQTQWQLSLCSTTCGFQICSSRRTMRAFLSVRTVPGTKEAPRAWGAITRVWTLPPLCTGPTEWGQGEK